MAPPYSKQRPPQPQQQCLEAIESIWQTVFASRRTIKDAREAIARADELLARHAGSRHPHHR